MYFRILQFYDPENERFVPPWPIRDDPVYFMNDNSINTNFILELDKIKLGFRVKRKSTKTVM